MRLPRPRLNVRRLMIVVALAGVALGGVVKLQRRAAFADARVAYHQAAFFEVMGSSEAIRDFEGVKRFADYHLAREIRWRAAVVRPWLPFEADPPAPE